MRLSGSGIWVEIQVTMLEDWRFAPADTGGVCVIMIFMDQLQLP